MLDKANIPYENNNSPEIKGYPELMIYRIAYPKVRDRVCSAIQGYGIYGNEENLIEIMGLLTDEEKKHDEVVGYLTAEEVFKRISKHYSEAKEVK